MKIKQIDFEGMHDIILSDFAPDVSDQVPLGSNIYADCKETVDISKQDKEVQIVLSSKGVTHADEGFGEDIMDGKFVKQNGNVTVKWDSLDDDRTPKKLYLNIINAGKRAFKEYLDGPYNHFKKHYKKIPLVVVDYDQNEKFVSAHKLV